jgi:hypothetical protein
VLHFCKDLDEVITCHSVNHEVYVAKSTENHQNDFHSRVNNEMTIKEAAIKWKKFPAQYKGKNEKNNM